MPWTINTTTAYDKMYSKANLQNAEDNKLDEWQTYITQENVDPVTAASDLGYKATKLKGSDNEWHFYIGSMHRVFFTYDTTLLQVDLIGLGHTD